MVGITRQRELLPLQRRVDGCDGVVHAAPLAPDRSHLPGSQLPSVSAQPDRAWLVCSTRGVLFAWVTCAWRAAAGANPSFSPDQCGYKPTNISSRHRDGWEQRSAA